MYYFIDNKNNIIPIYKSEHIVPLIIKHPNSLLIHRNTITINHQTRIPLGIRIWFCTHCARCIKSVKYWPDFAYAKLAVYLYKTQFI